MPFRLAFASAVALASPMLAQSVGARPSAISRYEARVAETLATQPHWTSALVTVSPRIEQGFRTDFVRQTAANSAVTWNYGGGKGLQFIPARRVELRVSLPPFLTHSAPATPDGFGDVAFRLKYRIYASPEQAHNGAITFDLNASLPTGKNGNGSCCAVVTPVLEAGKGFGPWAFTLTLGGTLPVSGVQKLGRTVVLNDAVQLHATRLLWAETEFNTVSFYGGKSDGHTQTFVTPGLILSRLPLRRARPGSPVPLQLTLGAGEQIALTHFHTYDHAPIFTARLRF